MLREFKQSGITAGSRGRERESQSHLSGVGKWVMISMAEAPLVRRWPFEVVAVSQL